jgi:murein DD-endopeptidase MepM/ murein hydrolase activator NlpD
MQSNSGFTEILKEQQSSFHPVVPFDKDHDRLLELDFTAANEELSVDILGDTTTFTTYIENKLSAAGAVYGIGGYAEHRTVYSISPVFDGANSADEPRRLHLGVDIWGKANTPVMAPLEGKVHSFAFNNRFGDYGGTIILAHRIGAFDFYTLYGHLSLASISTIAEGDLILPGQLFASFGIPAENGCWPPHLHFQLIIDMQGKKGDYPGVCKYSEREQFLANCPDPNLILQMLPDYR